MSEQHITPEEIQQQGLSDEDLDAVSGGVAALPAETTIIRETIIIKD